MKNIKKLGIVMQVIKKLIFVSLILSSFQIFAQASVYCPQNIMCNGDNAYSCEISDGNWAVDKSWEPEHYVKGAYYLSSAHNWNGVSRCYYTSYNSTNSFVFLAASHLSPANNENGNEWAYDNITKSWYCTKTFDGRKPILNMVCPYK